MSEGTEYGPDTFEVYTEKTLQKLSTIDFVNLSKYVNTDRPNYYDFNNPDNETQRKPLFEFVSLVLELSKIANIRQNGGYKDEIDEILEDLSKGSLSSLNRHASEKSNIVDILLSLAEHKNVSQGRISIPFTGGNLGIWVNFDKTVSFTGNKYYDNAATLLNETSKNIDLKVK